MIWHKGMYLQAWKTLENVQVWWIHELHPTVFPVMAVLSQAGPCASKAQTPTFGGGEGAFCWLHKALKRAVGGDSSLQLLLIVLAPVAFLHFLAKFAQLTSPVSIRQCLASSWAL